MSGPVESRGRFNKLNSKAAEIPTLNRQSRDRQNFLKPGVLKSWKFTLERIVPFSELMGALEKLADIRWKDAAAIEMAITETIPKFLAADQAYQNARKHSDPDNIRIEGEFAVERAISAILSDYVELFQQFTNNADFKKRLTSLVLTLDEGKRAS